MLYSAAEKPILGRQLALSTLCLIFFLLLQNHLVNFEWVDRVESMLYDLKSKHASTDDSTIDPRVVIVDVDEKSLLAEGQWPWPRARIADLLTTLTEDYQSPIIGIDFLFPEASRLSPDDDSILESALKKTPTVTAQLFQLKRNTNSQHLEVANINSPLQAQMNLGNIIQAQGYIGITPTLQRAADSGHISIDIDDDGTTRNYLPIVEYSDELYPSLSLQMLNELFNLKDIEISEGTGFLSPRLWLDSPLYKIPMDNSGRTLIPFNGKEGRFHYISASEVLKKSVEKEYLQGKIVVLGTSASGLFDLISTPWSASYPGVEIHAVMISSILDNHFIIIPQNENLILSILILLSWLLTSLLYLSKNTFISIAAPAAIAIVLTVSNFYIYKTYQINLSITAPALMMLALFLINTPAVAAKAIRQRQQIYRYFQDYVPRTVVDRLISESQHHIFPPEKRLMTVMFMDIRGFTSISEELSPEQLSDLMHRIFSPVTRIIHDHNGTIDKYMGDAVMAFWGAPLEDPHHAENASKAAIAITNTLKQLNDELLITGYPTITAGIGINSGIMTVGNMGSDFRISYTVIGDSVNIAARLEDLTKDLDADILLGEETQKRIAKSSMKAVSLGKINLRGRHQQLTVFKLVH